MPETRTCPRCGAEITPDATEGVCPRCLMKLGLRDEADTSADPDRTTLDWPGNPESARAADRDPEELERPPGPPAGTKVRYFGDYELLEEIARGGMGVVYRARQLSLNRIVAVKMILSGLLSGEEELKRFRTEAEAAASLNHPHIVAIHEVGDHEGQHYFSMEFIEGTSLSEATRHGPLPAQRAAELVKAIAGAIHHAHEKGTLHRDLKPSNIVVDRSGQPHVTDFGLARRIEGESELTRSGAVLGTPSYMPPEQAAGRWEDIGPPAEVYSLGAILYELLTGRPPFRAETPIDTLMQVVNDEPVPPRLLNSTVPRDLENVCLKCLEKARSRRYASARDLEQELDRFLNGRPVRARPITTPVRLWRWCRRNPALATPSGVVLVVLLAALVTSLVVAWRERQWHLRSALQTLNDTQHFSYSAARSLGEMGPRAREAVPSLLRTLEHHPRHHIRVHAAEALWKIDRHPEAIPALVDLQKYDPRVGESSDDGERYQWEVRFQAVRALGEIGPDARAAVPALIETLAGPVDAWIELREPTARALVQIGVDAEAIPLLVDALGQSEKLTRESERARARDELTELLARVSADAKVAVPLLVQAIKKTTPGGRLWAASFLLRCGPEDKVVVPGLIDALNDTDSIVRSWAACALSKIGVAAGAAIPELTAALRNDGEPRLRWRSALALGSIGLRAEAALPALREAAGDVKMQPIAEWAIERIRPSSMRGQEGSR